LRVRCVVVRRKKAGERRGDEGIFVCFDVVFVGFALHLLKG
jgi:hypothetical protein